MTLVGIEDFRMAFRQLGLPPAAPVIAHASLSAFGRVDGGAIAMVDALLDSFPALLMPAFTYKTMVTPEVGPPNNGLQYGAEYDRNRLAEFFRSDMPVDRLIGSVAEVLRLHPDARRSEHPILSFTGVNVMSSLAAQTLHEPLAPFRMLAEAGGWVLLLGVNHTVNTSIHFAERLAGRRQFIRWALTSRGVVECPGFPGCSDGFDVLAEGLIPITRHSILGQARIQAFPLEGLVEIVASKLAQDPLALLCDRSYCDRCRSFDSRALATT